MTLFVFPLLNSIYFFISAATSFSKSTGFFSRSSFTKCIFTSLYTILTISLSDICGFSMTLLVPRIFFPYDYCCATVAPMTLLPTLASNDYSGLVYSATLFFTLAYITLSNSFSPNLTISSAPIKTSSSSSSSTYDTGATSSILPDVAWWRMSVVGWSCTFFWRRWVDALRGMGMGVVEEAEADEVGRRFGGGAVKILARSCL